MKLEKTINDTSIFEKKTLDWKNLKEKLLQYQKINDKFVFWDYETKNDKLHDDKSNLVLMFTAIPSFIFELSMIENGKFLLSLPILLFGNLGIMFFLRNLTYGILRNRYKKWQLLRKDIQMILEDKNNMFNILLEAEVKLKNLQSKIEHNPELKEMMQECISTQIKNIKTLFSNYENNPDNIIALLEKFDEIDSYESTIEKNIKSYELQNEYIQYKKSQGIIEDDSEKEILESDMVRNFKAIL